VALVVCTYYSHLKLYKLRKADTVQFKLLELYRFEVQGSSYKGIKPMTNTTMRAYRHQKIADLLAIMWACNAADSDNAPEWTTPSMAGDVVTPLFKAVKGLLDADYDDWLVAGGTGELMRSDFKDQVIDKIMNDTVQEGYNVTSIIDYVLANEGN